MKYPSSVAGRDVSVVLLVNGSPAPLFRRLDGRMFAAVDPGDKAKVRVKNLLRQRVELVVTVDGKNLFKDDDEAGLRSQHTFVLNALQEYTFDGWRVDDNESREIVFGEPGQSVAAQSEYGSVENVGVVGVASYREEYKPAWDTLVSAGLPVASSGYGDEVMRQAPVTMGAGVLDSNAFGPSSVGAGVGASQHSPVGRTTFNRTGEPDVVVIGYDTMGSLNARGIIQPPDPDPFPGCPTGYGKYTSA